MRCAGRKCLFIILFVVFFASSGINQTFGMEIKVNMPTGQTVTVQTEPENTVHDVKSFVFNVTEIHMSNQRMFKDGVELDNTMTLASYGVSDGDTLYVKYGKSIADTGEKGLGGFAKTVIILVILAGAAFIIKKKLFKQQLDTDIE